MRKFLISLGFLALTVTADVFAAGMTDPTRPLGSAAASSQGAASTLRLQSILVSGSRKVAVINNQVLGEGERSQGIEVLSIAEGEVKVSYRGSARTLRLPSTEVRKSDRK